MQYYKESINSIKNILGKFSGYDFLFGFVFCSYLVLSLHIAAVPKLVAGDSSRDYIVSHLIASKQQFPLTGPSNGILRSIGNSPLYYYIISVPLTIYDDPVTLSYFQILVQLLNIFFTYVLAAYLFNRSVALLSILLLLSSKTFLFNQDYIWQPYLMVPFLYASFIVLAYAYKNKSYSAVIISNVLFSIALILHMSVLAVIPLFMYVTWNIVSKEFSTVKFFFALGSSIFSALILCLPNIIYYVQSGLYIDFHTDQVLPVTPYVFMSNTAQGLMTSLVELCSYFGLSDVQTIGSLDFLSILLLCTIATVFIFQKKNLLQYRYFLILVLAVLSVITACTLVISAHSDAVTALPWYLQSAYSLCAILLAYMVSQIFVINGWYKVGVTFAALFIFSICISSSFYEKITDPQIDINRVVLNEATNTVANYIQVLKNTNDYKNYNFFQVKVFDTLTLYETYLTVSLENKFLKDFVKIDNNAYYNFSHLNLDEYIFIICDSDSILHHDSPVTCMQQFGDMYKSEYVFEATVFIYDNYTISVFKRIY